MSSNRRQLLMAAGAAVVVAGGAGIYYFTRPGAPELPGEETTARPAPSGSGDLMQPGPLGEMVLGDPNAPVTVIEYASMTCPHCRTFHMTTFPELKEKYVDTGKVRFIMREYPLDPLASAAIILARCTPESQVFTTIDLLFEHQREWAMSADPVEALYGYLRQTGMTRERFDSCLRDQSMLDAVNDVQARGTRLGVTSTPTFFINGTRRAGALSIADFDAIIQPLL